MIKKTSEIAAGESEQSKGFSIPQTAPLIIFLLAMVIFFSVTSEYFLDIENFKNILVALAVTGIVCVPGTFLMIAGHVDLSVGSAAAVSGMLLAQTVNDRGIAVGLATCLAFGLVLGVINGFFVTIVGVNSLITTLGGLATLYGVALLAGNGQTVMMFGFEWLGTAQPFSIPLPIIIFAGLALVGIVTLRRTSYGRSLYAIGANPNAARVVGIRSNRILFITFVLSSVSAALAGAVLASQLSAGDPNAAKGLELEVVTAIVLGGASLAGGRGTLLGTVLGLVVIQVLNNGLILLDIPSFWQRIAQGILLIAAVSFDQIRQKINSQKG
jgi:ribose transport system permease protein